MRPAKKINHVHSHKHYSGVREKIVQSESEGIRDEPSIPKSPDSTLTPVFGLGYRELSDKFRELSSKFNDQAYMFSKHLLKLDLRKATKCKSMADQCERIADRILGWVNRSPVGVSGERGWVTERYLEIVSDPEGLLKD